MIENIEYGKYIHHGGARRLFLGVAFGLEMRGLVLLNLRNRFWIRGDRGWRLFRAHLGIL
jgi:hypothetical protein